MGIRIPFFGNGSDTRKIETTVRTSRARYVEDMGGNLKLVFFNPPRFHEYASKGTENKSTKTMTVCSLIGALSKEE
jgi:hypothetical protein